MANGSWFGSVQDESGAAVSGVAISVHDAETETTIDIFEDKLGTVPKDNPFLTGDDGRIAFYVRAGRINISADKDADSDTWQNQIVVDESIAPPPPPPPP